MSTAASQVRFERRPIVVVMGVSGSGKSTIGAALAQRLGVPFLDADDVHPAANVRKMASGVPLTDADRWPWLGALGAAMREHADAEGGVVSGCSALKRAYRQRLMDTIGRPVLFLVLDGCRETLFARMSARGDHYMPPGLLDSQLADLERPDAAEPALTLSIEQDVDTLVEEAMAALAVLTPSPSPAS
ncbi:gluconokinase [Roseospira marina]|uniref:Gluconokinase n=1 Tax=Roseospira marina TaxID=140057 RepID=A0A5M6IAL6_9PROT|nr:gluconokinase [Roseospira marina]KAA5605316.1 gluconokinase [Roseospira marina]MBB4314784.1 gluconokinase [Roseospira marina]MBB5087773.1 gluconokinase [Roseospira marina]